MEWEGIKAGELARESPRELFQNIRNRVPNLDLLNQNGEGLRVRGRWKMGWYLHFGKAFSAKLERAQI